MLLFSKTTVERAEKSIAAHGHMGDLFLQRNRVGRVHKIQFTLQTKEQATQYVWTFDATVPEARIRAVRDELYRLVCAGTIETPKHLEALRLAIKNHLKNLAVQDARKNLTMV
jgi:hypothetical protein